MEDGEDIYDDTGAEKMADEFNTKNIRERFQAQELKFGPKPTNVKPSIGGGPGLNLATGNGVVPSKSPGVVSPKSPGVVFPKSPGVVFPKSPVQNVNNQASSAIVQNSTQSKDSGSSADKSERRLSKVEEMKLQLEAKSSAPEVKPQPAGNKPQPAGNKPKTALKPPVAASTPLVAASTFKTNDQNNNANASTATSTTTPKFGNIAARYGQQAAANDASKSSSPASGEKNTFRKTSTNSVDQEPTSPHNPKPSAGVTAPNYAPVSVSVAELKKQLKHVSTGADDVTLRTRFSSSAKHVIRKSVIRKLDGRKFHTVDFPKDGKSEPCPSKPASLDIDLDLDKMIAEFEETVKNMDVSNDHGWTEMDEEYDDCGNVVRPVSTRVVSLIEPMTEEEETKEEQELRRALETNNLPPPPPGRGRANSELQEEYDDVAVNKNGTEELTQDEEYEELPGEEEIPPPAGPKPSFSTPKTPSVPVPPRPYGSLDSSTSDIPDNTEKPKDPKELEKEKKEREKEEKRKEKEKKEQEKKMKKLAKDLKVDVGMLSNCVAKGRVKTSNTPKKKKGFEIAVIEGEEVDIIRMVDNPKGKWLIKITSSQKTTTDPSEKIGYCDEGNIEVDTNSILNYMKTASSSTSLPADGPQENYEDVEGNAEDEPLEQDEIYEECS